MSEPINDILRAGLRELVRARIDAQEQAIQEGNSEFYYKGGLTKYNQALDLAREFEVDVSGFEKRAIALDKQAQLKFLPYLI